MTQRMLKRLGLVVALSASMGLMAQGVAPAGVAPALPVDPSALLKAIPADATAFVAVRSLKQLDQDIQDSAKALNLPAGTVPGLIGWVKGSLRLGQGFNENGSMALVLLNTSQVKTPEELENRMALFFPASDPKALATSMGGEKADEIIKLDLAGKPSFAAARGDFLVITKEEAALREAMKGTNEGLIKSLSADRVKAFAEHDIYGWAAFRGISKELRTTVREEITKNAGPGSPLSAITGSLDQIEKLLEEGQDAGFGISLDAKRGLSLDFYMSLRPDTDMGKQMAAMKPASGPLLAGLPGDPFVFSMGSVASPDTENQLRRALDLALSEETVGDKVDKEKLGQIRDGLVRLLGGVEQVALGVYALPAEDGQGMVNLALVAKVKNSDAWKQDAKKLFAVSKDVIVEVAKSQGEPEDQVKQVAGAVQWKDNAEKLGGANVDQLSFDISKLPEADKDSIDQVKKVIGPEGVMVRVGALGQDKVIIAFGGGSKRFEAITKVAASGDAPLAGNADVKKVADRLQAGPKIMEGFLNVDKLISLVMDISSEVGGGMMFPVALRNPAPVAFTSVKVGETGQQTEVLLPMELIRSVADIVRPMLMMGMGGGGGPQPGDSDTPEPPPSDGPGLE